jgi:hypothetical protein
MENKKFTYQDFDKQLQKLIAKLDKEGYKTIIAFSLINEEERYINLASSDVPMLEFMNAFMRWGGKIDKFFDKKATELKIAKSSEELSK